MIFSKAPHLIGDREKRIYATAHCVVLRHNNDHDLFRVIKIDGEDSILHYGKHLRICEKV